MIARPRRPEVSRGSVRRADAPPVDGRPAAHLRVNAIPWATVELDGRAIGTTPLTRIDAAPGDHVLRFTNTVLGVDRTEHLTLAPDEHRDVVVDLR